MLSPLLAPSLVRGANILWDELRAGAASGLSFAQELLQGGVAETEPAAAPVAGESRAAQVETQIDKQVQRIGERVRRHAQHLGATFAGEVRLAPNGLGQIELNGGAARTPLEDLLNTDDALLAEVEALQALLAEREASGEPATTALAPRFTRDFQLVIGPHAAQLVAA